MKVTKSMSSVSLRLPPSLFAVSFLFVITAAFGQTGQGALTGVVKDGQGAVVPKAQIVLTGNETGVKLTTATDSAGLFSFRSLNPGTYSLNIAGSGFQNEMVGDVVISAEQTTTINPVLKVGNVSETVTVTEDALQVNSTNADVATTVDHSIVEALPYPDRSALEAALLVPGVTGDPSVPGGIFGENPVITTGPVVPAASISISGAPPGTGSILVDGSDVTQASYPRAGLNLSNEVVQETTAITSGLSAKYGRTGGGIIVEATRAGTNAYHGLITWRHTDPFFNAFPLGSTAANAQHENYYGFYVGGPVRIPKLYNGRDKTFFFVAFEPARINNTLSFRGAFNTPEDLMGHLHNSLTLLNPTTLKNDGYAAAAAAPRVGGIYLNSVANSAQYPGFPTGTLGSAHTQIVGPTGVDDVSNQLALNPFAQYVLGLLPTPQHPGPYIQFDNAQGTYQNDGTNASYKRGVTDVDNRWSVRVDHQFNNANQIYVRYADVPISGPRFFALAANNPVNQVPTDVVATNDFALGYTHTFTSNLVGVFHYSFLRVNQKRTPPAEALTQDFAGKNGLTPAAAGKGFPALGTLGTSTLQLAASTPYTDVDQNYIGGGDFTWTHGQHLFQFGVDLRWIQSDQYDYSNTYGGKYSFSQTLTNSTGTSAGSGGNAEATFILGEINSYTAAPASIPGYYRWQYDAGYFQDDWRVAPKLTLNLGVRYEVETPRSEKYNNQGTLVLNQNVAYGTVSPAPTSSAAFCFSGSCGLSKHLWPINWFGIEPRIGIDYALTPNMTIRAAYGIIHLPLTGYENTPDPNFNIAAQTVAQNAGAVNSPNMTDYLTNPVAPLSSAYGVLNAQRSAPIATSQGFSPEYGEQTKAVPYTQNYNVTLQYELHHTLLQATYQGLKGTHLMGAFTGALNVPALSQVTAAIQAGQNLAASTPNSAGIYQPGTTTVVAETNLQRLNPYQNFFNQSLTESYPRRGTDEYNALYLSAVERLGTHLSLIAYYNWSKSMDDVPDTTAGSSGDFGTSVPQDPSNPFGEWAVSTYDQPSRLKIGYNANLPFGAQEMFDTHHRWLNEIIGNISTAGIMTMASGFPNFVTLGVSSGAIGNFVSFTPNGQKGCTTKNFCSSSALPAGFVLRPDIVPGVPVINPHWKDNPFGENGGNFTPYLNPAAFAVPGLIGNPKLGDAPRSLTDARSPREFLFDARVKKGFSFGRGYQLNLIGTFNNVFNHPVYFAANNTANAPLLSAETYTVSGSQPVINFTQNSTNFGRLNGGTANLSRVIRVGAEFVF